MQKISIRKLSILGLVLMAASAVTAAVMPFKTDKKVIQANNGSLTFSSALNGAATPVPANQSDSVSCELDTNNVTAACHVTLTGVGLSETSEDGDGESASVSSATGDGGVGANNTSDIS